MAMCLDLDLSKLSFNGPFGPKVIHRDVALTRRLERFTGAGWSWNFADYCTSYQLITLNESTREYQEVLHRIARSNAESLYHRLFNMSTQLIEVVRIKNPHLWHQFCLKRDYKLGIRPSTKVIGLFHGTKESNLDQICKNNLDWRRVGATHFLANNYGSGVSFSPCFSYASQFPREASVVRIMLLCEVLVDQTHLGNSCNCVPQEGCDATISPDDKVIVKYDDNEFYPKYVIRYNYC